MRLLGDFLLKVHFLTDIDSGNNMKIQYINKFFICLLIISCINNKSNEQNMGSETVENFLLGYLSDRYGEEFNINKLERFINEADFKKGATITAFISPKGNDKKEFIVFVNDKPTFEIMEDRYPFLLLQDYLLSDLSNNFDIPYIIVPKLSHLNPKATQNINSLEDAGELFKNQDKSFWYLYVSLIPKDGNLNVYNEDINTLISSLKAKGLNKFLIEFIFYKPIVEVENNELAYNPNAKSGERYAHPADITEKWIGQVGKKEMTDYTQRMKKLRIN